jgi:hypothetical protein
VLNYLCFAAEKYEICGIFTSLRRVELYRAVHHLKWKSDENSFFKKAIRMCATVMEPLDGKNQKAARKLKMLLFGAYTGH